MRRPPPRWRPMCNGGPVGHGRAALQEVATRLAVLAGLPDADLDLMVADLLAMLGFLGDDDDLLAMESGPPTTAAGLANRRPPLRLLRGEGQ